MLQKENKLIDTLNDIDESIKLNPHYASVYQRRGQIYIELKLFDEAKSDFNKLKELQPNNKDYKILNLERNATQDQIKQAHRKMALKWHPNRNAESAN